MAFVVAIPKAVGRWRHFVSPCYYSRYYSQPPGTGLEISGLGQVVLPIVHSLPRREEMLNRKGFTLIELLIVVVIIGILAAIAIPKFANTKEKAYLATMKSDLRNLITAEEAY